MVTFSLSFIFGTHTTRSIPNIHTYYIHSFMRSILCTSAPRTTSLRTHGTQTFAVPCLNKRHHLINRPPLPICVIQCRSCDQHSLPLPLSLSLCVHEPTHSVPEIAPNQSANTTVPLVLGGPVQLMQPLTAIQMALKNNAGVFYCQVCVCLYVCV